jgi:hypothetical protein
LASEKDEQIVKKESRRTGRSAMVARRKLMTGYRNYFSRAKVVSTKLIA